MEHIEFIPVKQEEQIQRTATLGYKIWHEYFPFLLSSEQIDYMVEKFQSVSAIKQQLSEGYEYYLLVKDGREIGYIGIHGGDSLFISKIYIQKQDRGKGYANSVFSFLEHYAINHKLKKMWLTVNRQNENSIEIYKKKGFKIAKEQVKDIGNGFVMDDFIMEKECAEK